MNTQIVAGKIHQHDMFCILLWIEPILWFFLIQNIIPRAFVCTGLWD